MSEPLPLSGTVVLDLSRMLPGAVVVRRLLELGARVIKVEDPSGGDYLRTTPPLVDGTGAGFHVFFRGAESVTLDLRTPSGVASVRALARHADVLLESFRPGTLARWGLAPERLRERNGSLITCSLSSYGSVGEWAGRIGHDLNFAAVSGFLARLPEGVVPRFQIADVGAGLQAHAAILAALLLRHRTGRGSHVEQPLATGPLPFLTWAMADSRAGEGSLLDGVLVGDVPAYRLYDCGDGRAIAVGTLEPKFWVALVGAMGLPHLAEDGLDTGPRGGAAAREVAEAFRKQPSGHWTGLADRLGLPVSPVLSIAEASRNEWIAKAEIDARGPALGEATARILEEFGAGGLGDRG